MNHISQRNQLEMRINTYVKFMKICPNRSVVKLAKEITRLQARVAIIRMMDYQHLHETAEMYFETKQSKSNFKTV
jgi:hypothetical protein